MATSNKLIMLIIVLTRIRGLKVAFGSYKLREKLYMPNSEVIFPNKLVLNYPAI